MTKLTDGSWFPALDRLAATLTTDWSQGVAYTNDSVVPAVRTQVAAMRPVAAAALRTLADRLDQQRTSGAGVGSRA